MIASKNLTNCEYDQQMMTMNFVEYNFLYREENKKVLAKIIVNSMSNV